MGTYKNVDPAAVIQALNKALIDNGNDTFSLRTSSNVYMQLVCIDYTTDCTTGDGKGYISIPESADGMVLKEVHAENITAGTTGTMDIQIANVTDSVDMLSTKCTIDTGETGSDTAATAAVVDTSNDDVSEYDVLRVDVDAIHSGTAAKGLIVTLKFGVE